MAATAAMPTVAPETTTTSNPNAPLSFGGLRTRFATLWLAATNPRRLGKEAANRESLGEACRAVAEYLSPFFIFNLDATSSALSQQSDAQSDTEHQRRFAKCRLSLNVAAHLLCGLQTIFDRKVICVARDFDDLLRAVRMHLNIHFVASSRSGAVKARKRTRIVAPGRRDKKRSSAALEAQNDAFFAAQDELLLDLNPLENLALDLAQDGESLLLKMNADFNKLDYLETDILPNMMDKSLELDLMPNNAEPNFFNNLPTDADLIRLSQDQNECTAHAPDHQKYLKKSFSRLTAAEVTPADNVLLRDANAFDLKRTPNADLSAANEAALDQNDLKKVKLAYDDPSAVGIDPKTTQKRPKIPRLKLDTQTILSSHTIKSNLMNCSNLVQAPTKKNFAIFQKVKIFLESEAKIEELINDFEIFKLQKLKPSPWQASDTNAVAPRTARESFNDLLRLRERMAPENALQNAEVKNAQEVNATTRLSRNNSDSSLRMRNAKNESASSLQLGRSQQQQPAFDVDFNDFYQPNEPMPEFAMPPSMSKTFNNSKSRDAVSLDLENMGSRNRFGDIFPPGKSSRRAAANAFHKLLMKANFRQIELVQKQPFGEILIT